MSDVQNRPTVAANTPSQLLERAVAVLEKFLAPDAFVEHNIRLPELVTGTLRQCDVVIRAGKAPRQTLTIVEAQDRGRNVELSDYEGWCQKREKLGAQHLICVSTNGFPTSVQRDAALRGDTIRLMTLLETNVFPPFFSAREMNLEMQVLAHRDATIIWDRQVPSEFLSARCDSKIFQADGHAGLISIMDIADREWLKGRALDVSVEHQTSEKFTRKYRLDLASSNPSLWLPTAQGKIPLLEAAITDTVDVHREMIPINPLAYEQIGWQGTLAWVFIGTGRYEGHELGIRIPVSNGVGGHFRIGATQFTPIPGLTFLECPTTYVIQNKTREVAQQNPSQGN
jgi:hypothetical protein